MNEKIVEYLNANSVPFESFTHAPAASAEEYQRTLGTRLQQQAKALFLRVKKTGSKEFAVVAIQAQKKADMNEIAHLLNAKEVRFGTPEQLEEVTGCKFGQLPPLGKMFGVPLLFDKDLLTEEKIYFNAGSLTFSIVMDPHKLVAFEQPVLF